MSIALQTLKGSLNKRWVSAAAVNIRVYSLEMKNNN